MQVRNVAAGISADNSRVCRYCGNGNEDHIHWTWQCPRTETFRASVRSQVLCQEPELHPCEHLAGIPFQQQDNITDFQQQVIDLPFPTVSPPPAGSFVQYNCGVAWRTVMGNWMMLCGLDGSCYDSNHPFLARAGAGVFWRMVIPVTWPCLFQGVSRALRVLRYLLSSWAYSRRGSTLASSQTMSSLPPASQLCSPATRLPRSS